MQTRTEKGGKNSEGPIGTGLVVERRFTTVGEDPFDQFEWIEMDVEIRNADGSLAHRIDEVRLPSGFSGVAGKGTRSEVSEKGWSSGDTQEGEREGGPDMATEECS